MPANKIQRLAGPVALSNTLTTNIYNPPALTGGTPSDTDSAYALISGIHVVNKDSASHTFSLWIGATGGNAAGTELFNGQAVAPNSVYDWYAPSGGLRMDVADFLVGGASAATTLTITVMGQIGIR